MYHRFHEISTLDEQYNARLALSTNKRNDSQKLSIDGTDLCLIQLRPEIPDEHPLFRGLVQLSLSEAWTLARSSKYVEQQP